jgi:GH15 family glucan-1,4-alpha-glucosidase
MILANQKPLSLSAHFGTWKPLASVGRLDDAQREFGNLLQYSNHLLLFSEDVDENDGSQWGNFPQAYSHVGLMNAALQDSDEAG